MYWENDRELFETLRNKLYTAVVGDIMDTMGLCHQFLPACIRPLREDMVIVGRAMTVQESDIEKVPQGRPELDKAFGLMFEALDDLKEDEVYICSGSSYNYALAGELMATRASYLKAVGFVVNGYIRDTKGLIKMGMPVFSAGSYAQDQGVRGKVTAWRVPITFGEVTIEPGDIIFGDIDGVLVIPRNHEREIIEKAYEKVIGENKVADAIRAGMSTVDAFSTFGIM